MKSVLFVSFHIWHKHWLKWIATNFQIVSSMPTMLYSSVNDIKNNSRSRHVNKNCSILESVSISVSNTDSSIVFSTFWMNNSTERRTCERASTDLCICTIVLFKYICQLSSVLWFLADKKLHAQHRPREKKQHAFLIKRNQAISKKEAQAQSFRTSVKCLVHWKCFHYIDRKVVNCFLKFMFYESYLTPLCAEVKNE